jgi:hypothetical protein
VPDVVAQLGGPAKVIEAAHNAAAAAEAQRPYLRNFPKSGLRFSMKALRPSTDSSVP